MAVVELWVALRPIQVNGDWLGRVVGRLMAVGELWVGDRGGTLSTVKTDGQTVS